MTTGTKTARVGEAEAGAETEHTPEQLESLWREACIANGCMPSYWYANQAALVAFVEKLKRSEHEH